MTLPPPIRGLTRGGVLALATVFLALSPAAAEQPSSEDYPWLLELSHPLPTTVALKDRFAPPAGFRRLAAPAGSYAHWLRRLPLRTDRIVVHSFDGSPLSRPSAAVLLLDVGTRNLMQCADSIIRLHAEFLWAQGRADEASYRFTSGDSSRWKDWREGEHFVVRGSQVIRASGKVRTNTHRSFRRWLDLIFTYAGTSSLARDAASIDDAATTEAGDFFVDPGFPGHAVVVLDVAEDSSGRRVALLAQGFMPAEEVHVLWSESAIEKHWFRLPRNDSSVLDTPSWRPFKRTSRRRLVSGSP